MPVYEYRCPVHGVVERVRPMSDDDLREAICECGLVIPRFYSAPTVVSETGVGNAVGDAFEA